MGSFATAAAPAIGTALSGLFEGMTAPSPYQPRTPYTGDASAQSTLMDAGNSEKDVFGMLSDLLSKGVQLPDAVVHNVDPVGGFSLGDVGSLASPASLPGVKLPSSQPFNFMGVPTTGPNNLTGSNVPSTIDLSVLQSGDPKNPGGTVNFGDSAAVGSGDTPSQLAGRNAITKFGQRDATGPVRNTFATPPMPSAQSDTDVSSDPTSAALAILRHAAVAA